MGRPIEWTENLKQKAITEIVKRIAEGESVRSILNNKIESLPSRKDFYVWIADNEAYCDQYARACDIRAELIFDEMFEIADDGSNDFMTKQLSDGVEIEVLNAEHIQRSRLRIDTRKWALSKMNPKKYGEKISQELTGKDGKDLAGPMFVFKDMTGKIIEDGK